MLEKTIKTAVKKRLKELGAYWFMPVQFGLGNVGLDFIVCWRGLFAAIETKRPGGKLTPLQHVTIEKMQEAGAQVLVIDTLEQAKSFTFKAQP